MRFKLRGKYWRAEYTHHMANDCRGFCDSEQKSIGVRPNMSDEKTLDTWIHELLHACLPDADETAVEQTATDIARALSRLGWRRSL